MIQFDSYFSDGLKPPTRFDLVALNLCFPTKNSMTMWLCCLSWLFWGWISFDSFTNGWASLSFYHSQKDFTHEFQVQRKTKTGSVALLFCFPYIQPAMPWKNGKKHHSHPFLPPTTYCNRLRPYQYPAGQFGSVTTLSGYFFWGVEVRLSHPNFGRGSSRISGLLLVWKTFFQSKKYRLGRVEWFFLEGVEILEGLFRGRKTWC